MPGSMLVVVPAVGVLVVAGLGPAAACVDPVVFCTGTGSNNLLPNTIRCCANEHFISFSVRIAIGSVSKRGRRIVGPTTMDKFEADICVWCCGAI